MTHREFSPGKRVVYRMTKHSRIPGPRAEDIVPAVHGDEYTYSVDKYWLVDRVLPSGQLVLRTRRGKRRLVHADDPNLGHASWWESWKLRDRFPTPVERASD